MIEQPLGAIYSLFRSVEEQGFAQRSIVRRLEERSDAQAAGVLNCPPSAPLIYLERLRLADGIPIVLDCSWLPAVLARPLLGVDFTHTALYHELHVRCGVQPDAGWERIRPVLPNPEQRGLLRLPARTPALAVERLATWQTTPVEWRHSLVRGDRFCYVARWSAQDQAARFEPVTGTG
jgi:GntR family transcriptional regulator